jgi:hypothetical protein
LAALESTPNGGFDTASLQGGPDEQRAQELQLADRSGLHRTAIGLLENACRTPQIATVQRLAEAVEVDITVLLEGTFHG